MASVYDPITKKVIVYQPPQLQLDKPVYYTLPDPSGPKKEEPEKKIQISDKPAESTVNTVKAPDQPAVSKTGAVYYQMPSIEEITGQKIVPDAGYKPATVPLPAPADYPKQQIQVSDKPPESAVNTVKAPDQPAVSKTGAVYYQMPSIEEITGQKIVPDLNLDPKDPNAYGDAYAKSYLAVDFSKIDRTSPIDYSQYIPYALGGIAAIALIGVLLKK